MSHELLGRQTYFLVTVSMLRLVLTIVAAFVFVSVLSGSQDLRTLPKVQQVFVLVCDGLTLRDLERMDEPFTMLMRKSAIGLLSGSSAELKGKHGVFVTLGSGKRAKANERARLGKWLKEHGVSVSLDGDGILAAILGEARLGKANLHTPKVDFIATPKAKLPIVVQEVLARLHRDACLWLLVPNSPRTDWLNRRLTPIFVFGEKVPTGLLTSPTTRRVGLVSSVDFAPTLLSHLSIPIPAEVTGKAVKVDTSVGDPLAYLLWLDERGAKSPQDLLSLSFTISLVFAIAITLVACFALCALHRHHSKWAKLAEILFSIATFVIVAWMSIPASSFFAAQLPHRDGVTIALQLLAAISLLGTVAVLLARKFDALPFPLSMRAAGLICAFSAVVALLGVPLYWATPLGHFPTTGWRYFGITNSGIGIVLAGTIFAWKLLALPKRFVLPWLVASPFLMGFSLLGANFGGALTLAIGFAAAWELIPSPKPSWRRTVALGSVAFSLMLLCLFAAESFVPVDQQGHLGALLRRIDLLGIPALTEMVHRKLTLLWEFFVRTPLSFLGLFVFVAFQIGVANLAKRNNLFAQLKPAFNAVFIGSWVGLVLNDTGMEVVGIAMVSIGGVFLLSVLEILYSLVRGEKSAVRTSP